MHPHPHVIRVVARPAQPRPAKVIALDVRRKAREAQARPERKPAA